MWHRFATGEDSGASLRAHHEVVIGVRETTSPTGGAALNRVPQRAAKRIRWPTSDPSYSAFRQRSSATSSVGRTMICAASTRRSSGSCARRWPSKDDAHPHNRRTNKPGPIQYHDSEGVISFRVAPRMPHGQAELVRATLAHFHPVSSHPPSLTSTYSPLIHSCSPSLAAEWANGLYAIPHD